jgi:hypothetical protein
VANLSVGYRASARGSLRAALWAIAGFSIWLGLWAYTSIDFSGWSWWGVLVRRIVRLAPADRRAFAPVFAYGALIMPVTVVFAQVYVRFPKPNFV